MTTLTASLITFLRSHEGPLAYALLAGAAAIEYLVPPVPGDSVTLLGVVLAMSAGFSPLWVYAALYFGSMGGAMTVYGAGRYWAERRERLPRWFRSPRVSSLIEEAIARFERRGAIYLSLNRFVPALRAVFFLAAGMARMPVARVFFFGSVSALAWNAALFALAYALGATYGALRAGVGVYSAVIMVGLAVVAGYLCVRFAIRRRLSRRGSPGEGRDSSDR